MRGRSARLFAAIVCGTAMTSGAIATADSLPAPSVFTLFGTGTVSPGYPFQGCAVQPFFGFSSLVSVNAGVDAGLYDSRYTASSGLDCETVVAGQGPGTLATELTTLGGTGWYSASVNYIRFGTSLQLVGTINLNGHVHSIVGAECAFWYTSVNPATSYQIECDGLLS